MLKKICLVSLVCVLLLFSVSSRSSAVVVYAMQFLGEWQFSAQYETQDVVMVQGVSYVAISPSVGLSPVDNPSVWTVFEAPRGSRSPVLSVPPSSSGSGSGRR